MTRKAIFTLALILSSFGAFAQEQIDNQRLTEIYKEDQAARKNMPMDWEKVAVMDKAHHEEVLNLLRSGHIRTSADLYHAAMVMQHGDTTEDYQLAFSLSRLSATIDPSNKSAKWLSAASWDRILKSKNLPQWYGTQYFSPKLGDPIQLYRVDESVVSDEERAALNVPSLQRAKDMLLQINK